SSWRVRTIGIAWQQHALKRALGRGSICTSHVVAPAPPPHTCFWSATANAYAPAICSANTSCCWQVPTALRGALPLCRWETSWVFGWSHGVSAPAATWWLLMGGGHLPMV